VSVHHVHRVHDIAPDTPASGVRSGVRNGGRAATAARNSAREISGTTSPTSLPISVTPVSRRVVGNERPVDAVKFLEVQVSGVPLGNYN
jgi:hypothetical protein